jgi:polyhydroxybutyrate depolymerase
MVALALVACGGAQGANASAPSLQPGDHEIRVRHGGRTRLALVHVPSAPARTESLPLVLAFHGGGGEAGAFKAEAGLDAISDRAGFVVAYPFGTGPLPRRLLTWNAGVGCCGYAREQLIDDVGFAITLIEELSRQTRIDARRIYLTGHSNGAMMAYRVAAERADRIAAIAPVGGAMDVQSFAPSQPVAVLHIHSVDDPRALYSGGLGPPFPGTEHRVMHRSVEDGLAGWREHNGCPDAPTIAGSRQGEPGSVNDGQSATLLVWAPCTKGGAVEHWKLTGVGHGWPGHARLGAREAIIGAPTTLVDAAEEVWGFVSRFRR